MFESSSTASIGECNSLTGVGSKATCSDVSDTDLEDSTIWSGGTSPVCGTSLAIDPQGDGEQPESFNVLLVMNK